MKLWGRSTNFFSFVTMTPNIDGIKIVRLVLMKILKKEEKTILTKYEKDNEEFLKYIGTNIVVDYFAKNEEDPISTLTKLIISPWYSIFNITFINYFLLCSPFSIALTSWSTTTPKYTFFISFPYSLSTPSFSFSSRSTPPSLYFCQLTLSHMLCFVHVGLLTYFKGTFCFTLVLLWLKRTNLFWN